MKKVKILCLPVVLLSLGAIAGCSNSSSSTETLKVVCLNRGFGREWIDDAVAIWEQQNPGYKIDLNASQDASSIINGNLAKRNNDDDVYITNDATWKRYAGQGKLLAIDDILEQQVDGMKLIDKINDEYRNSIYFKDQNGETHTYRLPWTSGVGGIMYNAKMFRDNNWTVPTTVDELIALCQDMVDHPKYSDPDDKTSPRIYPFAFTGENTDYFDYIVFNWWSQISGVDAINTFKNYGKEDSWKFDTTRNETYAGLKEATAAWYRIFGNEAYFDAEDITRSNHSAQKNFLQGKAAMMINGDWVYNEMLNYSTTHTLPDNFELKIMPTPKIRDTVEQSGYIIGEDQFIAIPASTKRAELAKSFVKTLISDAVLQSFFKKAHGMMAYKLSSQATYDTSDTYMNSILSYRTSLEKTYTSFSMSPLYLNNQVDIWGQPSGRPYLQLLQGTLKSIDEAFVQIKENVERQWGTWVSNSNM